jgi:formylglycine-generating enzyme required for sulfatase activity
VPEQDDKPAPSRSERKLTGFYVALGVLVALGLFGAWFWRAYTVWWFDADEARRRQAAAAQQLSLPVEKSVDLGGGVSLDLVLIPAGRFKMGSPVDEKDRNDDEPLHWVLVTQPFYLGKYEVTQEQWEKVMGANPSYFKDARNPVENVSWNDAQEFLKKVNEQCESPFSPATAVGAGVKPAPTNEKCRARAPFRLPTEAEWEWACRAGTRTTFCSGDTAESLANVAWFRANSGSTAHPIGATHPVGTRKPNAWSLYDMHGNVFEWCEDWYGEYAGGRSHVTDPVGPATGSVRVLRGGSWLCKPEDCRSANRGRNDPVFRGISGLRVVAGPVGH